MIVFLLAAAASFPTAKTAAIWSVEGPPGAIRKLTGAMRTGGRIVADRFVEEPGARAREKAEMAGAAGARGSCARVAGTRPFTRLRRFSADGRLLWEWDVGQDTDQAVRLLAPVVGDCLSPDGRRLLVSSYRRSGQSQDMLGGAVVAVDDRPRFVEARGRLTGELFGPDRITSAEGWRKGGDATLVFSVSRDTAEHQDVADLAHGP